MSIRGTTTPSSRLAAHPHAPESQPAASTWGEGGYALHEVGLVEEELGVGDGLGDDEAVAGDGKESTDEELDALVWIREAEGEADALEELEALLDGDFVGLDRLGEQVDGIAGAADTAAGETTEIDVDEALSTALRGRVGAEGVGSVVAVVGSSWSGGEGTGRERR